MKYYTHAGLFHADEIMGYVICQMAGLCDKFIRLIDLKNIPNDGIIADIGREYDPERLCFDHHQGEIRRDTGFMYATAGLLWKYCGFKAIRNIIGQTDYTGAIHQRVDERLIKGIDAHDADSSYTLEARVGNNTINVFSLSNVISMLNADDISDLEWQNTQFQKGAFMLHAVLTRQISDAHQHYRAVSKFDQIAKFRLNGTVIVLDEVLPWKEIVCEQYPDIRYVISPSMHPGNPWSMFAVPVTPESRVVKLPIERPSGFTGFIHQGKWIAGSDSVEELIKLAKYNLYG